MNRFTRSLPSWCFGLGFLCSGLGAAPVSEVQRSHAAMVDVIGPPSCHQDTQCRIVAVGADSCGGPAFYLAWSSHNAKAVEVQRAAARHTLALQAHQNSLPEALREQSVCVVRPTPTAQCQLQPQQAWGRCALAPVAGSQADQLR